MTEETSLPTADITKLLELLPHRYPFLLIDRLMDIEGDRAGTGVKNVTINEPFFVGHFPGAPVMPGVLIIEAMAQTAGAVVLHHLGLTARDRLVYFMSIDEAKFRKPVVPGDVLHLPVTLIQNRGSVWKYSAQALVNGTKVAEAKISAMIAPRPGDGS